jgi:hypothetical protein
MHQTALTGISEMGLEVAPNDAFKQIDPPVTAQCKEEKCSLQVRRNAIKQVLREVVEEFRG